MKEISPLKILEDFFNLPGADKSPTEEIVRRL